MAEPTPEHRMNGTSVDHHSKILLESHEDRLQSVEKAVREMHGEVAAASTQVEIASEKIGSLQNQTTALQQKMEDGNDRIMERMDNGFKEAAKETAKALEPLKETVQILAKTVDALSKRVDSNTARLDGNEKVQKAKVTRAQKHRKVIFGLALSGVAVLVTKGADMLWVWLTR